MNDQASPTTHALLGIVLLVACGEPASLIEGQSTIVQFIVCEDFDYGVSLLLACCCYSCCISDGLKGAATTP